VASQRNNHKISSGVSGFALLKMLPQFPRNTLQTFSNLSKQYFPFVRFKGFLTAYQLTHANDIEGVLQTNQQNYRRGTIYAEAKSSIGKGLLNSEGDFLSDVPHLCVQRIGIKIFYASLSICNFRLQFKFRLSTRLRFLANSKDLPMLFGISS
jgi:hypothetical protein